MNLVHLTRLVVALTLLIGCSRDSGQGRLTSSDPDKRIAALDAIQSGLDHDTERKVADLMWRDPVASVRDQAAKALGRAQTAWAREELGRCGAESSTLRTRLAAVDALADTRDNEALKILISLWALNRSDDDGVVAVGVDQAVARYREGALSELLDAALGDRTPAVRAAAARALRRLDGTDLRQRLLAARTSVDADVRANAAQLEDVLGH